MVRVCVDSHDHILTTSPSPSPLPVERPLVKNFLDRIAVAIGPGLNELNWKSSGIDAFVKESMSIVEDTSNGEGRVTGRVTGGLGEWVREGLTYI